jgi:hypothetical protein
MHVKTLGVLLAAAMCVAACEDNEGRSMGNGPGNADGTGGRTDPPEVTTDRTPNDSSIADPAGSMTKPDGSTEDTGATPRDPAPANH